MLRYSVISSKFINAYLIKIAYVPLIRIWLCVVCLSSAEAPAGFPNKNSNNRKTGSARRREVFVWFSCRIWPFRDMNETPNQRWKRCRKSSLSGPKCWVKKLHLFITYWEFINEEAACIQRKANMMMKPLWLFPMKCQLIVGDWPRGVLPIMAYTARLYPKGVSGFMYIKG